MADRGRVHRVNARMLIAAIAVLGAFAAAPAAQAGTAHGATFVPTCSGYCKGFNPSPILRAVYTAAPGESNVVSTNPAPFDPDTGSSVFVRDQGADVFATGRCARVGTREARCGPDYRLELTVRTGDRDDVYEGSAPAFLGAGDDTGRAPNPQPPPQPGFELEFGTEIDGDEGADVLAGGPGFDTLRGGEGDDRLAGAGDFGDRLFGGSGHDRVVGGPGGDSLKGESGRDRVSGGAGNDELSGNSGDDRVGGDAGRDTVYGRSGKDLVRGGPDSDKLDGGSGRDRIDAGSGNDRIAARDGRRDRVRCGSGRDTVTADRFDALIGCEVRRLPRR